MPANIIFPEFTDDEVFLESKEDANLFFESIEVPNATQTDYGVVKKAGSVAVPGGDISGAVTLTTYRVQMLREDGTYEYAELCDVTEVKTILQAHRDKINGIILSLQTAGLLA